jgi:hypothetical protein
MSNGKRIDEPAPPAATRRWNALLVLLLALCIVRLWLMPLGPSLWADETATYFVVHYGGHHPSLAVAPHLSQSTYYWLPWMADKVAGFSEVAYRVWSENSNVASRGKNRRGARDSGPRPSLGVVGFSIRENRNANDSRPTCAYARIRALLWPGMPSAESQAAR